MIGRHTVTVTTDRTAPSRGAPRAGSQVDLSCLVDQVTVHHGRDDPSDQPEAPTCTLDLSWRPDQGEVLPPELDMGAVVTVTTDVSGTAVVRFCGRVTDLSAEWDDAGTETPDRPQAQVVCAGFTADLGRRVVGDEPFPQELDGARVSRVLDLAGVVLDPLTSDPGVVQILPRDIDSQPALAVVADTAGDAQGVLWETRDGLIRYADSEHRRSAPIVAELDACDLLVTPKWVRDLSGLINEVSIGYGPEPEEGEQARFLDTNDVSVDTFGRYNYTDGTTLATLADAQSLAALLLGRNASPVWLLTELPVDLAHLDSATTLAVLGLDMHALIQVTGLPVAGDTPTATGLFVEGWTETLAWGVHELDLNVSGYCRTVPPPRWDDVPNTWTWDTVDDTLAWDEAGCFGPPVSGGRWSDVPASLRWDQVAGTVTWDTWKG